MKELALNILDIAENSVRAGAALTEIQLADTADTRTLTITDDGCGMDAATVARVTDPFCTTRTTRKVGLGLPLLKLEAEQTGGTLTVTSRSAADYPDCHGTVVVAVFRLGHIDCLPLGDVPETMATLIQGHPDTDFRLEHQRFERSPVTLDTRELRAVLEEVPLNSYEVLQWIRDHLREQYAG